MPHIKFISSHKLSLSKRFLVSLPLVASLNACSADVVNLGENHEPLGRPAASLCRDTTTLTRNVLVTNQEQLNELTGCMVIDGDLSVDAFAGADLRPLHSLRIIGGSLSLGEGPVLANAADANEIESLIVSGWLTSLEGLESLERAKGLSIRGLSASLEPLEKLRTLGNGHLQLDDCPNLRDLRGLEGLREFSTFYMFSDDVESIAALQLPEHMDDVIISGSKLVEIGQQAVRTIANGLALLGTAVEDLNGLSALRSIRGTLTVSGNARMKDMNALNGLMTIGGLVVRRNAELLRLPDFPAVSSLSSLIVHDNPKLIALPEFAALHSDVATDPGMTARNFLSARPEYIEVVGNPEVLRFVVPLGWRDGVYVSIENNTKLRDVDFGRLQSIDLLSIVSNPALESVALGALSRVDVLQVLENPSLQVSMFDSVETFEREMSGNAGP